MIADIIVKLAGFEKEEKGAYFPRPSLAGPERCVRQLVYWALGCKEDREVGDRYILTMDDSSFHEYLTHDWIQKSAFKLHSTQMPIDCVKLDFITDGLTRLCKVCDKEVPLNVLHGHIDGVIQDMLGQEYHYEHKAINTFSFERYWNGEYPLDYITQCCIYQKGLRNYLPNINKSILLMKNKNTAQYLEMIIEYNHDTDVACILEVCHSNGDKRIGSPYLIEFPSVVSDAIEKFRFVNECVINKTLPDRPYEIGTSFPCHYCQYEKTCLEDYEQQYDELVENANLEGDVESLCKLYLEQVYQEKEIKDYKEELKKKLKDILKSNNASKGRAGDYLIHNRLQKEVRVMRKEDIPSNLLPLVTHETVKEVFTVTKIKKKGDKK